jgi:hypothetical protein
MQTDAEFESLGYSLMGSGNHHFLAERADGGKGAFLTKAHAAILSSHPLFKRDAKDVDVKPEIEWSDLKLTSSKGEYVVSGRVTATPKPYAVVAYHDPNERIMDYDATSWVADVNQNSRFKLRVDAPKAGEYELRLCCYLVNNACQRLAYSVAVDASLKLVCPDFDRQTLFQLYARPAIEANDNDALAAAVEKLSGVEDVWLRRAAAFHRVRTQPEPERRPLSAVADDVREVALTTVQWESAKVGREKPMCNRIGDTPFESAQEIHDEGLFAYADSRYVYLLDGAWRKFVGGYGLQKDNSGDVVFVIKCDGEERFRSDQINDWNEREVEVDLAGVKTLELIVESGDAQWGDAAIWFEPKLTR